MNSPHDELCPPPPADDDDLTLPRASMNKMIKELVSAIIEFKPNVSISNFDFFCMHVCRYQQYE